MMKKSIIAAVLLLAAFELDAQDSIGVKSFIYGSDGEVLDTLDTSDARVKIIIYANGTWKFRKETGIIQQDTCFTHHWSTTDIHPYGDVKLEDLPSRLMLCLKDSLENYCCPDHVKVYSKFGVRRGRRHMGCDLPSPVGTPVYATFAGKVRFAKYSKGYGNLVIMRHRNGLETYYGHLSEIGVKPEQWVEAGQVIGKIGSTGRSTGPHLHFETRYNGYAFDPEWLIDFNSGNLRSDYFMLKRKYFSAYSKYTPESIDEEEEIMQTAEQEEAELKRLEAEKEAMRWYTIKSGDTLSGIAYRNGTTVSALCRLNGMSSTTTLKIGRKIRVR